MAGLRRLQLANAVGVTDDGLRPLSALRALTNLRLSGLCRFKHLLLNYQAAH